MAIDHSQSALKKPTRKRRAPKHTKKAKTRKKRGMVIDLDKVARREIVEERDGNTCQRCGVVAVHIEWKGRDYSYVVMQWAHVHTRRWLCLRWVPENSLALCSKCHKWFDNNKVLAFDWFAKKFPERWELLLRVLQSGETKTTDAQIREMWRCAGGGAPR